VAGDSHDAVGGTAELADVLLGRQHDAMAALTVPGLVDDEHPVAVRPQLRMPPPQRHPPRAQGAGIPGGVVQEVV